MSDDEMRMFNAICDEILGMLRQIRTDLADIAQTMERIERQLNLVDAP